MNKYDQSKIQFIPIFKKSFLQPKYWGHWLLIGILIIFSVLPIKIREPFLSIISKIIAKIGKKARHRAFINLYYCLPELSEKKREKILGQMFSTIVRSLVMLTELMLCHPTRMKHRIEWHGREIIDRMYEEKQQVIFFVPHTFTLDIPGILLASEGKKIAAMIRNQRNQVIDYLWNCVRIRFGGRIHARKDGIQHFINSVRKGYWGYYLSDEDYKGKYSEFADFFATYKATLPAIGRLMKLCRARIIPLFPVYNLKNHKLEIYIRAPMDDLIKNNYKSQARRVNEEVEFFVRSHPEQYAWVLKFLKTRKQGEVDPYSRKDIYTLTK